MCACVCVRVHVHVILSNRQKHTCEANRIQNYIMIRMWARALSLLGPEQTGGDHDGDLGRLKDRVCLAERIV